MKKNRAIAIFCLLFIILAVLVISYSLYDSKNNNENNVVLAALVKPDVEGGGTPNGFLEDPRLEYNNICASEGFKTASRIAGLVILIAKWLAPLILMVVGMIDFFKAIISSSDKALGDATTTFIKRMVIAIIIPFIPGLIYYLVDFLVGDEVNNTKIAIGDCTKCLKEPLNEECKVNN